MRFPYGAPAVRRGLFPDHRIAALQSGRVVSDDKHGLLLWVAAGSATIRRTGLDGAPTRHLPYLQELRTTTLCQADTWKPYGSLMLTPPDAGHSIWWTFDTAHRFVGWYVNLETPSTRWFGGTDHFDQALDLLIDPDGTVRWKDLDEFAEQCAHPELFWDTEHAAAIRRHAEDLAALAEQRAFPFDGAWTDFRPDPAWSPTELPWWWDQPPARPPGDDAIRTSPQRPDRQRSGKSSTSAAGGTRHASP